VENTYNSLKVNNSINLYTDSLQRGTVQPANEKRGRGKEVYFDQGTADDTYKGQILY
jgi:hypothetical protein